MVSMKVLVLLFATVAIAAAKFRIIKEVPTDNGSPGATSELNTSTYSKDKAFKRNYAYGWRSQPNYGNAPEIVWYHFRQSFVLGEVTFRSNGEIFYVKIPFPQINF